MMAGRNSYQLVTSINGTAPGVNSGDRMETIAARLKALRDAEGLSSRAFAERLTQAGYRVSHVAVLGYEKEDGGPESQPGAYLAAVCREFNVAADWLLFGRGPRERPTRDSGDPYLAGQVAVLDRLVTQLTAELADARRQAASLRDAGTEDARRDGSAQ